VFFFEAARETTGVSLSSSLMPRLRAWQGRAWAVFDHVLVPWVVVTTERCWAIDLRWPAGPIWWARWPAVVDQSCTVDAHTSRPQPGKTQSRLSQFRGPTR